MLSHCKCLRPRCLKWGMARHNLQVKAVMVPLFFSVTITANVPRWSQMYPDVTRIPGWQAQAPLEKHNRSCMGTFSRRFKFSQCYVNTQQLYQSPVFFWRFLLTFVTTASLLLFRSSSESESSMADDLEKIREKNEAGGWSEVNELAEAATHRVPLARRYTPCKKKVEEWFATW